MKWESSIVLVVHKLIMMKLNVLFTLIISLLFSIFLQAQDFEAPTDIPATKEEFIKSEPSILAAANWLASTPIGTEAEKRIKMNAYLMAWLTKSPTVSISVTEGLIKPFEKNPDLMFVFFGGYIRYCIEHHYNNDALHATVEGMKTVINCYNLGGSLKKDKGLNKLLEADKKGNLEEWVKSLLETK